MKYSINFGQKATSGSNATESASSDKTCSCCRAPKDGAVCWKCWDEAIMAKFPCVCCGTMIHEKGYWCDKCEDSEKLFVMRGGRRPL